MWFRQQIQQFVDKFKREIFRVICLQEPFQERCRILILRQQEA